jgi:hypothetical protein
MPAKIRQGDNRKKQTRPQRERRPASRAAPQKQTGADLLLPSDAAAFLNLSEESLFWLWQFGCRSDGCASLLPAVYNLANEVRFMRGVLDSFKERVALDLKLRRIVATAKRTSAQHRPFWHRAAENLGRLGARAAKSRGDRNATYRYLISVYEVLFYLKERSDEETIDHHHVRSLFAELLRRTSTLSKATVSRNSRALAFCYGRDIEPEELRLHIGSIKPFVAKSELPCATEERQEKKRRVKTTDKKK